MSYFFSSRRRHTRCSRDWSSDVCSSDLRGQQSQQARCVPHGRPRRRRERRNLLPLCYPTELRSGLPRDPLTPRGGVQVHFPPTTPHSRRGSPLLPDRKSVVQGKSVDLGG